MQTSGFSPADTVKRQRTISVKKILLMLVAALLVYFWFVRPMWYEAWCCATRAEDTWLEVYDDFYADGAGAMPFSIACNGMCAGMDLYVCYPLSVDELLRRSEEAYGAEFRVVSVEERSRWRTCCVVEAQDGSGLQITLTSMIMRWHSDNGDWLGFQRYTFDDHNDRIREMWVPMLGY